jgi:hypothetical protein
VSRFQVYAVSRDHKNRLGSVTPSTEADLSRIIWTQTAHLDLLDMSSTPTEEDGRSESVQW